MLIVKVSLLLVALLQFLDHVMIYYQFRIKKVNSIKIKCI
ncbi:Hypothetical protein C248_0885 [Staphylococcus aureus 08BA02176]|nr:Hypothetical protein C248_0885 [Staphylococcus aureus 08BA02176]CAQ49299.1 hypothetical protein SAPIG0872 [Staphylococcus aureus subsp. aureus ST398]